MMDYVKMEAEYNCSKEVGNKKIILKSNLWTTGPFQAEKGTGERKR